MANTNNKNLEYWLEQIATVLGYNPVHIGVSDITALTDEQLDALNVGDKVVKLTGTAGHLYTVTYKDAENGGLCLSYFDAANVETVSYDHSASGWTYNSTDKTSIGS